MVSLTKRHTEFAHQPISKIGCGLRGDLERPDPIFSEPEAEEVVETPTTTRVVRNTTVIRRNADGDIIPDAAPSTPVSEGGLEDIE